MIRLPWLAPMMVVVGMSVSCSSDGPGERGLEVDVGPSSQPLTAPGAPIEPSGATSVGQALFGRIGCNGCHTVDDVGGIVGPNLSGVGARPSRDPTRWPTTEAYIRASLEDPEQYVVDGYTPDMPPPDLLGIADDDIDELVAYLLTLTQES